MATSIFNTQFLTFYLLVLGISGIVVLMLASVLMLQHYGDSPIESYNWRLRNWRWQQLTGVACLFFLAMAASYWVIHDAWGWMYLLVAFKTGTWWFRKAPSRGI